MRLARTISLLTDTRTGARMTLAHRNLFVVAPFALFVLASAADATYLTTPLRTPLYSSASVTSVWLAELPAGKTSDQQSTGRGYKNSDGERVPSPQLSRNGAPERRRNAPTQRTALDASARHVFPSRRCAPMAMRSAHLDRGVTGTYL